MIKTYEIKSVNNGFIISYYIVDEAEDYRRGNERCFIFKTYGEVLGWLNDNPLKQ